MISDLVESKFAAMGSRVQMRPANRWPRNVGLSFNVRTDKKGEYFEIRDDGNTELTVLDVRPADRHLLLMAKVDGVKSKFLAGHDERHLFVAAIPESASVTTVASAKEALKPTVVHQRQVGLKSSARQRRKNSAYVRQGEWFLLPMPDFEPDPKLILKNEPLRRSNASKAHMAEFCYREGGELVYVSHAHPQGVSPKRYEELRAEENSGAPGARYRNGTWQSMTRGADVYVKGRLTHADHKTVSLYCWYRVEMNTENKSRAMAQVTFLD